MGKFLLPTLFLFLAIWTIGGSYWYANRYYTTTKLNQTPILDNYRTSDPAIDNQNDPAVIEIRPLNLLFQDQATEVQFTEDLKQHCNKIKAYLDAYPESRVQITGYTDDRGSEKANIQLSRLRAERVQQLLLDYGFQKHQLITQYHGSKDPVAPNISETNRMRNRRVEIRIQD